VVRAAQQRKLFDLGVTLPTGFVYRPDFLTPEEERTLLDYIEDLPLEHAVGNEGYEAKRRVMHFGWSYDFSASTLIPGPALPSWLRPTARKIAKWLDIPKECVVEALVTEYPEGAAIGWHRDNEMFETIIGVSLAGWCRLRLRPTRGRMRGKRTIADVVSLDVEPRSVYVMQEESRWFCQHSVPPVESLRYSITFRTLPK
jgi:DNA oxidative demethylase